MFIFTLQKRALRETENGERLQELNEESNDSKTSRICRYIQTCAFANTKIEILADQNLLEMATLAWCTIWRHHPIVHNVNRFWDPTETRNMEANLNKKMSPHTFEMEKLDLELGMGSKSSQSGKYQFHRPYHYWPVRTSPTSAFRKKWRQETPKQPQQLTIDFGHTKNSTKTIILRNLHYSPRWHHCKVLTFDFVCIPRPRFDNRHPPRSAVLEIRHPINTASQCNIGKVRQPGKARRTTLPTGADHQDHQSPRVKSTLSNGASPTNATSPRTISTHQGTNNTVKTSAHFSNFRSVPQIPTDGIQFILRIVHKVHFSSLDTERSSAWHAPREQTITVRLQRGPHQWSVHLLHGTWQQASFQSVASLVAWQTIFDNQQSNTAVKFFQVGCEPHAHLPHGAVPSPCSRIFTSCDNSHTQRQHPNNVSWLLGRSEDRTRKFRPCKDCERGVFGQGARLLSWRSASG